MSFEEWFGTEVPRLLRFTTVLCGDSDLAEDLVQEVVVKLEQRWDRIGELEYRDRYIRRMLVNEFLSFRRRLGRIVLHGTVETSTRDERPDFTDQHADRAALVDELSRLPPRQRAVLVLRYFDDADDLTIAEILGCRPSTVRSHAARALNTLRVNALSDTSSETHPSTEPSPHYGEEDPRAYRS